MLGRKERDRLELFLTGSLRHLVADGYGLHEALPDHSRLTRIRQRWGAERFRRIFERTLTACGAAGIAKGEVVPVVWTVRRLG